MHGNGVKAGGDDMGVSVNYSAPGQESDMAKTVVALIHDIDEAQSVVHDLVASGIQREDIGFRGNDEHAVPRCRAGGGPHRGSGRRRRC